MINVNLKPFHTYSCNTVVSFSGGRTSGFLLYHVLKAHDFDLPDNVQVIFENTGKERLETLDFIDEVSKRWGVDITWLEWRKELGLPPVPQTKINDMMNQTNIVVIDKPRTVNVMRKHTYLWGLITFYRAVK